MLSVSVYIIKDGKKDHHESSFQDRCVSEWICICCFISFVCITHRLYIWYCIQHNPYLFPVFLAVPQSHTHCCSREFLLNRTEPARLISAKTMRNMYDRWVFVCVCPENFHLIFPLTFILEFKCQYLYSCLSRKKLLP